MFQTRLELLTDDVRFKNNYSGGQLISNPIVGKHVSPPTIKSERLLRHRPAPTAGAFDANSALRRKGTAASMGGCA
jgi:hypothetical protein